MNSPGTQPNLLKLAKQGNPKAIAALMNRQLHTKGITAKTQVKNGCLQIMLESAQVPKEQAMVAFVHKGMMSLGAKSIQSVRVYGRQTGEEFPAWTQEFTLETKPLSPPPGRPLQQASPLPDATVVPTTGSQPQTQIWQCVRTLTVDSGLVHSIAITPDGQTLVSGCGDKTIKVWDLNTGKAIPTLMGHF